ncbi:MAG TPA: MFS transporter, partial [Candidatus Bathyarchaeia archaeon]|nr:MFS transporter [Candidatus Bathyarchaeia archaeon]
ASSVLVARAHPERGSASLSLLNFFWSLGAVACPLLFAAFQSRGRTSAYLIALAVAFALLLIVVIAAPLHLPTAEADESRSTPRSRLSDLLTPTGILIGALFYLYVGTEGALGIWLATYAHRATVVSGSEWITAPSYFYGALLVGRLLAPAMLRRVPDAIFARLSASLALIAIAALLYSKSFIGVAACAALTGLGFSALYPISIGYMSSAFGSVAQRVAGAMFALSTLGAATIPWFIGYLSNRSGSLRTALFVTLAGTLAMLVLFFLRIPLLSSDNPASPSAVQGF